jgi:CDP-4-dehydro-6-deoxyglucose reductase, E1
VFIINYSLCDDTWNNQEIQAIQSVIDSNQFTMKHKVKEYEIAFSNYVDSKYAVMCNSGSSANLLAIAALVYSGKLPKKSEIIVPAVSWGTTYHPLLQYDLNLKFVDIDRQTFNIDYQQIEEAITKDTKAIFCVNLLGNPNQFNIIQDLCNTYNLILIEDNCEALGGKFNNQHLGTFGLLGTYSTFFSHHISTIEGGMIVTNNEELYHYLLSIRSHGWTRDLPKNSPIYKRHEDSFYESYNFILPGYNLRPTEIQGAIGIEQLKKLDDIIEQRRNNANYFINNINRIQGLELQKEIGDSSWFGFGITINNRANIIDLLANNNIDTRPIVAGNFINNPVMSYYKDNFKIHGELLNAQYIHDNGFFIGNHSKDNRKEIDYFFEVIEYANK